MAFVIAQACADCGELIDRAHLSVSAYGERLLCPACHRDATDTPKQDAEVWLLEQMFTRSAA